MEISKTKRDFLDNPLGRTKITSANVSFKEAILGYLLGPILAFITNALFNTYLNKYFRMMFMWNVKPDDGILTAFNWLSLLLPFVGAIFVVIGNLVVGKLIDKTKTSAGKARPYMLVAIPLIIAAVILIFITDPTWDIKTQMALISIGYILYYGFAFPFYYTSHASMVALSTRDASKRSLLGTFSNASSVAAVGLVASILVPMFLQGTILPDAAKDGIDAITQAEAANVLLAWKIVTIVLCLFTAIGITCEYYFTRERITEENIKLNIKEEKVSTAKQFKAVCKNPFWWLILLYFFFWQLGGQIKNATLVFYAGEFFADWGFADVGSGPVMGIFGIIGGIPLFLGMLLAWPLANKFGKARTMWIGLALSVIGGCVSFINPGNWGEPGGNMYLALTGLFLKGTGAIPATYVSMGLLSDVLNHLEAKNKFRSDGVTMAIYGAIMVGMGGVATALSNIFLVMGGLTKQITTFLYFGIEIICYAILVVLLLFLNVEKFNIKDHEIIRAYQKEKVLAEGGTWIEPEERLKMEQEEANRKAEENRIIELKARCEKKGLSFETEEAKYQAKLAKRAEFMAKFKKAKKVEEPKLEDELDVKKNEEEHNEEK